MSFRSTLRRGACGGALALAGLLLLGCRGDANPFQPAADARADSLYWTLTVEPRAALISTNAPYDTVRLVATPRDNHGNPIAGLGPVTFRSSDPARMEVTPDGLVRAHSATLEGEGATITAELTAGNVRHTVDAYIAATDTTMPPVPAGFFVMGSGVNAAGDSATIPLTGDGSTLTIRGDGTAQSSPWNFWLALALDADMNPIPNFLALAVSSDSMVAGVLGGAPLVVVNPKIPGRTTIAFSGLAYGVPVSHALDLTVTLPAYGVVKIEPVLSGPNGATQIAFRSPAVRIVPGGTVVWANLTGQPVDIVFDDSTNVAAHGGIVSCAKAGATDPGGAGNIAPFGEPQDLTAPRLTSGNCRSRSFPTAGTYTYHSALTGATGQIIVTDSLPSS